MERYMKKFAACSLFFVIGFCLQAQTLSWDISFLKGNEEEAVSITRVIGMSTGEQFKISVRPEVDCFSYVIAVDSERKIFIVHDAPIKGETKLLLGPMQVQNPSGTETFHVIMSLAKQTKLEDLIQKYKNNPGSRQHTNNLNREIASLQNEVSLLGEASSVFIPSGGTTRSNVQENANRFSGKNLYIRTITIRH